MPKRNFELCHTFMCVIFYIISCFSLFSFALILFILILISFIRFFYSTLFSFFLLCPIKDPSKTNENLQKLKMDTVSWFDQSLLAELLFLIFPMYLQLSENTTIIELIYNYRKFYCNCHYISWWSKFYQKLLNLENICSILFYVWW